MTNEEALNDIIESGINLGAGDYVDLDALKVAVKALEKQIPMKPLDIQTPVVKWGVCPNCKGLPEVLGRAQRVYCSMEYCYNCGQAIDWTEETK